MLDRREVIAYYNTRVEELKASQHRMDIESNREVSQLKNIPVALAMRKQIETIGADMPLPALRDFVYRSKYKAFAVVENSDRLVGIISLSDCEKSFDGKGEKTLTAKDIATRNLVKVTEEDSLFLALTRITQGDFSILPVVDKNQPDKILGVISHRDIMSTYDDIVIKKIVKKT
jgi:CIC family chloride channel protein